MSPLEAEGAPCPPGTGAAYCGAVATERTVTTPSELHESHAPDAERVPREIPWSRLVLAVVVVALGVGLYLLNEWRKTTALRGEVLTAYDRAVAAYRRPVQRLDGRIAELVTAAARSPWRGDRHDPIFRIDALQKGKGFYLRVPREAAASTDALRSAARRQHSDAVGACLAVQPALYGRLLVLGTIVTSDFRKKILQADGVVRLRALDHDFVTRAQRDLPGLAELLRPDWLMAVLEGGDAAHQVHVWDLHSGRELLRVRPAVEADLMTVRWSGRGPVPTKASSDPGVQNTVRDCAIAAGVREAAGEEVPLPPTSR